MVSSQTQCHTSRVSSFINQYDTWLQKCKFRLHVGHPSKGCLVLVRGNHSSMLQILIRYCIAPRFEPIGSVLSPISSTSCHVT